jgi:hypothetical protein
VTDPTVSDVSADLAEIIQLAGQLGDEAASRAGARLVPGGLAMVGLAPVASPEAWANLIDHAETTHYATCLQAEHIDCDIAPHITDHDPEWESPLQTLLFWSEQWRAEHGKTHDLMPTIRRHQDWWPIIRTEAEFLRGALDWAWDHEPRRWADLAADVKTAKLRLEAMLHAGERPDLTPTPCLDCHPPVMLERVYGKVARFDTYRCPRCKRDYDHSEYLRAQDKHLGSSHAERWVPWPHALAAMRGRPERTVRQWVFDDTRVPAYCDVRTRVVMVWWPALRDLHRDPPTRGRPHRVA